MGREPSAETRAGRRHRWAVALLLVVVALVRWDALDDAPLWHDELWLRDIVARSTFTEVAAAALVRDDLPVPAPLTLGALHLSTRVFGSDARELRLLPYLAGLLSLLLTARLARRCFGRRVALTALLLMAASPLYAYYSQEAKQYGLDMAWALLLLTAFEEQLRDDAGRGRRALFAVVALAAVLSSYSMAFVLPGLALVSWRRRDRRARRWGLAVCGLCGTLLLALIGWLALPQVAPVLTHYWRPLFPPRTGVLDVLAWAGELVVGLANTAFNFRFGHLVGTGEALLGVSVVGVFVMGAWRLRGSGSLRGDERRRRFAVYLWVPVVLLVGACLTRVHPLGARLVLFHSPLVLIVCALGLVRLVDALVRVVLPRALAGPLTVAVALAPAAWLVGNPFGASTKTTVEPLLVMQSIRDEHPADPIYLHHSMVPQLAWVWWRPGELPLMRATGTPTRAWYAEKLAQVVAGAPGNRFWLVHIRPFGGQAEIMDLLGDEWRVVTYDDANGCRIVCLERDRR